MTKIIKQTMILCLSLTALGLISCAPTRLSTQDVYNLQKTANAGHAQSQVTIGEIYEFGAGVALNHLIAAQWYQLAAKQGDPEAQFYLGVIYERGVGLKRNTSEAMKWLFKSAEQGHEKAQILLAVLYLKDKEVRQDFSRRIKKYKKKAQQGDTNAQYNLGWVYLEGAGLPVDVNEGLKWYRKAAKGGNPKALFAMGDICLSGRGTKATPSGALYWYRKSAKADMRAQVRLYRLYQGESGIPPNAEAARHYLKTISQNTDASLRAYLDAQHTLLKSEQTKNPALALRTCSRISDYDPHSGKVEALCDKLHKEMSGKMKSHTREAKTALEQKDWNRFGNLFDRLLTPDFDASQFRGFLAPGWRLMEQEARDMEKIGQDQLRALEAALRSWSARTSNTHQINKLMNAFQETIDRGLHDHPEDAAFSEMARKGKNIIASLRRKMKAPPPPEEKAVAEPSEEDLPEDIEPGEEDYAKALELFNGGRFEEAEGLFEKTTQTRGSRHIASAYIYLGISHLARINPANVSDARSRRIKGLACFQNALRFDEGIALPAGYDKYQPVFDQAKKRLY